jgi:hypothetical protein
MSTFADAIVSQTARTQNGMRALNSTHDAATDLFFKIGAMRGQNPVAAFEAAFAQEPDLALRIALWARDVRGGAGERKVFRDILSHLDNTNSDAAIALLGLVPELGRWDDLLVVRNERVRAVAVEIIRSALFVDRNGLCAKWMPRKGEEAALLRKDLGMTPRGYRKLLVSLTNVVETQMCAKNWNSIDFSKIPSLAAARYKNAFLKNAGDTYRVYLSKLASGDESVKVNAGAVYPYDVVKNISSGKGLELIRAQWEALPNYVGDRNILPVVDVSGSMHASVGGNKNLMAIDVAVSLGMYLADKNAGKFKDCFLTFSESSKLVRLRGDIVSKYHQISSSEWGMSTNLHSAFTEILRVATESSVPQEEMPEAVLILSDMQFNQCVRHDDRALDMIRRKYEEAGYTMPNVVFWNLVAHDNAPAKFNEKGVALISGFSPAIMKSVLAGKMLSPRDVMLEAVMQDRYTLSK